MKLSCIKASMDWEANLAAIIKCTDANLAQQFRGFEDCTAEFTRVNDNPTSYNPSSDDVASMATEYRLRHQHNRQTREQLPSYSRVFGAFERDAAPATTFLSHLPRRQFKKRSVASVGSVKDNQQTKQCASEDVRTKNEDRVQDYDESLQSAATQAAVGGPFFEPMYSSPTYDVAQMMEQVRLSLKLEVDARAVIAERQLSALLQLCKATSEELDRLRVEVCANDRQLHTLDQVQSKIRQELTTQKDIGFQLQSMCGKDESWRMQAENQLLELRQMVASLREQGNSTQVVVQEKLSRSELLVQFNAAMEPIKAQLQANLQHQAQQIVDITRTTSSSSLLLDGITQKVNRGITEELNELRSEVSALKHHIAKVDIFQDKKEIVAKEKEDQQQLERRMMELREGLQKELCAFVKDYVDTHTKLARHLIEENGLKLAEKIEMENLRGSFDETCRIRCAAVAMQLESEIKVTRDQLRGECTAAVNDSFGRMEKSLQQMVNTMSSRVDGQVSAGQTRWFEFVKMLENEQNERKQTSDALYESLRKSRHQLEDQLDTLVHETRTKFKQQASDVEIRLLDAEKRVESAVADGLKNFQASVTTLMQAQEGNSIAELEQKIKCIEETLSTTNVAVAALSKPIVCSKTAILATRDTSVQDVTLALEKQTSVYVSTVENLFQGLQQQLQQQAQTHVQMTTTPFQCQDNWPAYTYAANQAPPTSLLHLSPTVHQPEVADPPPPPSTIVPDSDSVAYPTSDSDHFCRDNLIKSDNERSAFSTETLANNANYARAQPLELAELSSPVIRLINKSASMSSLAPQTIVLSDQIEQQCLEQNSSGVNETMKREGTLATTAKGALVEAELAKARVEGRRKQEQDLKHQRQHSLSSSAQPDITKTMELSDATDSSNQQRTFSASLAIHPPIVLRSVSSPALAPSVASSNASKTRAPVSVPGTPMAENLTKIGPSSSLTHAISLQQPSTRGEGIVSSAQVSVDDVKTQFQPPQTILRPSSAPSSVLTQEVESSEFSSVQSTQEDLILPPSHPDTIGPPLQNSTQESRPPLSPPTSTDKASLSSSPLAKMLGQSLHVEECFNDAKERSIAQKVSSAIAEPVESNDPNVVTSVAPTLASPSQVAHYLCGFCRLPVRSDFKIEHERSQCPERMVDCVFCKKQVPWVHLKMHQLECNATKTVALNEKAAHSNVDTAAIVERPFKQCRHCATNVASLSLLEHELNCEKVLKQCPHCLRRQKMSELENHIENCDCRLVSCPNDCGGKFLQRGISTHLATRCPKNPAVITAITASSASRPVSLEAKKIASPRQSSLPFSAVVPLEKVVCKFCDDEIEARKIEGHEQNCDWKPMRCRHCNMVVIFRDLLRHETSCKEKVKTCTHCHEKMSQAALTGHASRCFKRPIKCIRCCQHFPADAIVAHSTNCKVGLNAHLAADNIVTSQLLDTARTPFKIPPPPPFPPPLTTATPLSFPTNKHAFDMQATVKSSINSEKNHSDRLARRHLALSQLTNPEPTLSGMQHERKLSIQASLPSPTPAEQLLSRPAIHSDHIKYEEEDDNEEFDGQLTLAQVVKGWSVENVCLWLHEDVGVPDVVHRFQDKHCDGEMLLELTEIDLVNEFGVKDRVLRDRILSAIEAINTSNAYSDEDGGEDEEEEDEYDESEKYDEKAALYTRQSNGRAYSHPRDILRRPSSQHVNESELLSSNDMVRSQLKDALSVIE